jgi:GAF domain-containing protein/HAMP domain-containing protein
MLVLIPVLLTGIVATYISSQGLRTEVFNQLESVATLKDSQITTWLESLQTNLDLIFTNSTSLQNITSLVLDSSTTSVKKSDVRNELISYNNRSRYFTEIFVMDEKGQVILSTDEGQEGKILTTQAFFHEGLKAPYITPPAYELALSNYSIVIAQPLKSNTGKIIGVLAGRANLSTLNSIMQQRAGLGSTGETYVVSSNFAVLTNLRFGETVLGQTYIHTDGATNAIRNKSNGSGSYQDYRDTAVVGVYHWIPELQIAVIAEADQSEALAPANQVFLVTLGLIVLTVIIASIAAYLITQSITAPITILANAAENISKGNFDQRVEISQRDEIGVLANSFNSMTERLRDLIGTLELRVADRTRALATTSEISRRLSTILDQNQLVKEVVEQVQLAFNYYHVHIYFFDKEKEELVMAGGTGEAGKAMLEQGHRIPRGRGLVGRAAENNEPILVSDTTQSEDWISNPLLPDTASEVAIPITIGTQVLGVLDVQHNVANGLQRQDIDSLQAIANQIAIALQNIRQFENSTKIANDLGVVANVGIATSNITDINKLLQEVVDLSKASFNLYHAHIYLLDETGHTLNLTAGAGEIGKHMVAEKRSIPMDSEKSIVARCARIREGVVVNDVRSDSEFLPHPLLPNTRAELAVPMVASGNLIGVLDVQADTIYRFTDVDVNIKTTLASQVAIAVQNARNFQQTQKQAERETMVNLITQKIQSALTVEDALQTAARELGHALGMKPTMVTLDPSAVAVDRKAEN